MSAINTNKININKKENNLIKFSDDNLYNDIEDYFNELENFSKNTQITYRKDIKDFFNWHVKKEINHITQKDLNIDKKIILGFRQFLIDSEEYANATINKKIRAVKSLYATLSSIGYDIDMNMFSKIRELPKKSKPYGTLTPEEAFSFAECALNTEREQKKIKYYLIQTAIRTSLRRSDLLNLKWSDFVEKEGLMIIKLYEEKTDKDTEKPLTKDFYNDLLSIKVEGEDRVFVITRDGITDMMKRLRKKLNIPDERNIVFHSFRNVGINFILDITGDIKAAAQQGNHSNINTTYNSYIDRTKNYDNMAGVLMDRKLDETILESLDKDELLELIEKLSFKSKIELLKLAEESKKQ